jgi:RNA polymerase sigma factor (sigma-70 family)
MAETKMTSSEKLTMLANRLKKGNRKAAATLYDELAPKVFGYLYSRLQKKEASEDITQQVFIKLLERIGSFSDEKGRFTVWFWQIVRNTLIDHYRQRTETPFSAFGEDAVESFFTTKELNLDEGFQYYRLQDFLGTLAKHERDLFEMRYVADLPFKEISVLLEKPEGALRVAAFRVKEKIRKNLEVYA